MDCAGTSIINLETDNSEIEHHLEILVKLCLEGGAELNDRLNIRSFEGDLSISAPAELPTNETLIKLPPTVLLPIPSFELELRDTEISIASISGELSATQQKLLESMVAIYNITDKVHRYQSCSTDTLYHLDRELLVRLTNTQYVSNYDAWSKENFLLQSFLKSRYLKKKVAENSDEKVSVLMPLVDFFNHHPLAPGFSGGAKAIKVTRYSDPEGGEECYVRYGRQDDHQILVGYGYTETRCPAVLSIPMELPIGNTATLKLLRNYSAKHNFKQLPTALNDLAAYLSPVQFSEDKRSLTLGCLRIPPKNAPRAMRRILSFWINRMDHGGTRSEVSRLVDEAEITIVDKNHSYYTKLLSDLESCAPVPGTEIQVENIKIMARSQLNKIEAYSFERAKS